MIALPSFAIKAAQLADAWIVGSAADPYVSHPRDIDILVSFEKWPIVAALIPPTAKLNSFGGFKFKDGDVEIDVWPGQLEPILLHAKLKFAWNPKTGVLVTKSTGYVSTSVKQES